MKSAFFWLLVVPAWVVGACAAETAGTDTTTTTIPDLTVTAPGIPWGGGPVSSETLRSRGGDNLAEALLPAGGLAAGQEIPAPGRGVTVAARLEF